MFGAPFEARFATWKVLLVFTSHVFLCNIRRTAQRCPSTRASAPVKRVVPGKAVCSCCRWCQLCDCTSAASLPLVLGWAIGRYIGTIWIIWNYGILWNTMEYYGILWNTMEYYGILWSCQNKTGARLRQKPVNMGHHGPVFDSAPRQGAWCDRFQQCHQRQRKTAPMACCGSASRGQAGLVQCMVSQLAIFAAIGHRLDGHSIHSEALWGLLSAESAQDSAQDSARLIVFAPKDVTLAGDTGADRPNMSSAYCAFPNSSCETSGDAGSWSPP